ncbi:Citrate lyase subunit beta-like protein [Corynebacterium occultum]|uniref:Citrate lyase subunit beta-like protein n=2 Tax=Corynebacterium occultum TaxID=2675219 RepID=A0A6B8W2M5_9CORY|nr:Citrate lyase subunit beta-like protein [Corynebacterium occultum]
MAAMTSLITGPALLFAPAHRPELLAKAVARADMVIIDLEDGAGEGDREVAREVVRNSGLDPARTIVRTVGPQHPGFRGDVEMLRETDYQLLMVPKLRDQIPAEVRGFQVIAMVETPEALINIAGLSGHEDVVGLFWGAEDLTTLLGGTHSRHAEDEEGAGTYREPLRLARSQVLIHAAARRKFAIDAIYADFRDEAGQRKEAVDAARIGFAATACIHPGQVAVVREAYRPAPAQISWAKQVLAGAEPGGGAYQVAGAMVDAPIIEQARRIIARA